MRFRYDPTSGALYFRTREGAIEETVELPTPGSYVDVDSSGRVMGLEFLSVHEFLAFLVASGGEAEIPEQVDPGDPARDLERLFHGEGSGRLGNLAGEETSSVIDLRQAQDTAGRVAEQAQDAVEQAGDLAQETTVRISRRFFENWLEQLEEHYGVAEQEEEEEVASAELRNPDVTQAASQMAEDWGLDLSRVQGSGPGGRIILRDVVDALNRD